MEHVLRTENLTKTFGDKEAVSRVSMTIKKGDIYGFIGKNGAGKTTLMRLVLGVARPDSGEIELFDGENLNSARHRIGSLLENPCLYKGCTAFENLKRFSILTGSSDKEISSILKLVGLSDTEGKKVGKFSLGMKQRLGIGIALLGNPEFLILDEPINGLDPAGIKEIRDIILRLNREKGITILLSSHLLDEMAKIVTTYGIIDNGVLVEEISAHELQAKCRQQMKITVDDPDRAYKLLSCITSPDKLQRSGSTIYMFEHIDRSAKINRMLVRHGIYVRELSIMSGGLEEYFIERLGG